jgi:CheY-like chemotaxis protein
MTTRRVLVVDDDPAIRRFFGEVLRRAGFSVDVADGGATALQQVGDSRPDLVTLDLAMPGIDGLAVIQELRGLTSPPPVVVVSGAANAEAIPLGHPVVALLSKPLLPSDLVAACERALETNP